jgi:hypothetical protein
LDVDIWDESQIENRAKDLFEYAIEIWWWLTLSVTQRKLGHIKMYCDETSVILTWRDDYAFH